jgi:hypothetical protein
MEVIDLKPTPEGGQYAVAYTIFIYHHFKNQRYFGTKYWHYMPTLVTHSYSNTGLQNSEAHVLHATGVSRLLLLAERVSTTTLAVSIG